MMAAAHSAAHLIGNRDHIMRVNVAKQEADETRAVLCRPKQAYARERGELLISVSPKIQVVLFNGVAPDRFQVIHCRMEPDGPRHVWRACFKLMGPMFP